MKKRIFSFILCISIVLSICIVPTNTSAAGYSVYNALSYAKEHWNDGVGLCAEFVSKCVRAGGLGINVITTVTKLRPALTNATGLSFVDLKTDSNGYVTKALNGNNVAPGDVVIQYCFDHSIAPHVLLFAGYNSNGQACYYAHNGALNFGKYSFKPGSNYYYRQHTPACNMGPKVIRLSTLDPNPSVPSTSTTTLPSVTPSLRASFSNATDIEYTSKMKITETNAVLVNQVNKLSGVKVTQMGLYLYDENGNLIKKHTENISNVSASQTKFHAWYDINKELGITLTPGTTYQYKFFGVFDGSEVAAKQVSEFSTSGSAPTPAPSGEIYVQYAAGIDGSNVWNGSLTVGEPMDSFPTPTPPEGYTFKGWYTAKTGGEQVDENTIFTGEYTMFYAQFEKELTVTVTFDANGGYCDVESMEIPGQCTMGEVPEPIRYGYDFLGWYTKLEDGVQLKEGTKVNVTKNFKVFALWEELDLEPVEKITLISLFLDANGGYCDIDEVLVEKGEKPDFLPTPERSGYKFLGWYMDEDHGNKEVTTGTTINVSKDITLTAKWEENYEFPFTDVASSQWYYEDVRNAHRRELINGKSASKYAPDDYMTIAEAIKLAACMHQIYHEGRVTIEGGSGENWYEPYVEYAKENGIPWNASDYNAHINRRTYVYIFYYAFPEEDFEQINRVYSVPDVAEDDKYADQIYAFYRAGIITGNDAYGTFNPMSKIQRSEVAAILSRMMDKSARKEFTLK